MNESQLPGAFQRLLATECLHSSDIAQTADRFFLINKSIADLLAEKSIADFPDSAGETLRCDRFFDDWFLYAVPDGTEYTCSLLKFREQEHDAEDGSPADGDMPGVTVSFISFTYEILLRCLTEPTAQNRRALNDEINRVVAYRGQRHHKALKRYFMNPESEGAYLVAVLYAGRMAAFAENGTLAVPDHYKEIVQRSISYKRVTKFARLPRFIDSLNRQAGRVVCDHTTIHIQNPKNPDIYETAAILATHTGNTSVYSFAAEVEYHARYLTPLAKIKIPFFGKSIYDSAIRADMTVGDTEFEGPAPFYRPDSRIVQRQYRCHKNRQLYFS